MNIIVCVKQVPLLQEIKFNPETKTIVREGVTLLTNSLDRRALTQALKIREQVGGTVTVITMGPPQAKAVLTEALAVGADRGIHLVDRAFAGSDTLATSRTLAAAIKRLEFDLVFCGRFSIDAETGQVGPEVAELLDIPQVTNLSKLELQEDGRTFRALRETDDGIETLEIQTPCLLTAGEFLITPVRRPTPEELEAAQSQPTEIWTAADVDLPLDQMGLAGSPTSVSEIRELALPREKIIVSGADPDAAARQLMDHMLRRGLFTPWQRETAQVQLRGPKADPRADRAVWVVAEAVQGRPRNVTLELLGKGAELAGQLHSELAAVLMGSGVGDQVAALAAYGADRVYLADHPSLGHYDTEAYAGVVADAITNYRPYVVLLPSTVNGRDLAPRVAARLGLGLTGDCIDLEIDGQERLVQLKPAFGGNIVAPIISRTTPAIATIRPGMLAKAAPQPSRGAVVQRLDVAPHATGRVRWVSFQSITGPSGVGMDDAEVVVSVGAGVGSVDNLPMLYELADALGGTIAASLRAVAVGLQPGPLQVGLTGRAISPRFYIAVAIRGALNHMIGVQKAETILAINSDPEADIFKVCDFGIVGDYARIVPVLTRLVKEAKVKARVAARA